MTTETSWRRRWKPTLATVSWRPILGDQYLIKYLFTTLSYELMITDKINTYYECLGEADCKKRSKKFNPSVEAPLGRLLDHIKENLDNESKNNAGNTYSSYKQLLTEVALYEKEHLINLATIYSRNIDTPSKIKEIKFNPSVEAPLGRLLDHIKENLDNESKNNAVKVKTGEEKLIVSLETKLAGLPFVWKFNMKPCSPEMVAEHFNVPLMGMVGELVRRQNELIKIICNKDKEIDDYKNQGVKVTRKHLQTSVFDEMTFQNNMNTSQAFESQVNHMGSYSFTPDAQELYGSMMCKSAFLNRDKTEDEDMNDASAATGGSPTKTAVGHSWANRVPGSLIPPTTGSSSASASKSPKKSPHKVTPTASPVKDTELLRRQALERKLAEEEEKMEEKQKKKKKKLKL